jgi:hypothetical protein
VQNVLAMKPVRFIYSKTCRILVLGNTMQWSQKKQPEEVKKLFTPSGLDLEKPQAGKLARKKNQSAIL